MSELPYSFHLGSNKNRKATSRNNAKNNLSNTTTLSNNGIQNYQQLSKVNNHDFRKYDEDTRYIYTLKGSNDVVYDVKNFYKKEFEEVRQEYNNKQSRPSRKIDNYFENVNKDEKRDLACEIIIELGNKSYWDTKDFEFKEKMVNVYAEQINDLEELIPEFKITNAVVHLDETSPHMHIVGIPIKENCKTGLSKQVNKSAVFTKDRLEYIQSVMREKCIESFNKNYNLDMKIKTKEKGRNKDINVKDMGNYEQLKKELEVNKKSIEKNNDKITYINRSSKEINEILSSLEGNRFGGYKLTQKQKERLENLVKDVESMSNYFDNYKNIINNISSINDNLKYQKEENSKLIDKNNKLSKSNDKLEKELIDQKGSNELLNGIVRVRNNEHLDLIIHLSKGVNSKENYISSNYKKLSNELLKEKIISKREHRIIFNPPFQFNRSEFEQAIKHISKENEQAAEEFYQMNSNSKEKDIGL